MILIFATTLVLLIILFVLFYIFSAILLKWLPSNRRSQANKEGIDIWIVSNGAHTDICLPLKSEQIDWTTFVDTTTFKPGNFKYITFGWGDKGFYLETPSWAELKPKVAFKALFKLGNTTMQVVLHEEVPQNKWVKSLKINGEQYQTIIRYIKESFLYNEDGRIMRIHFAGLPAYEKLNYNFYEAEGRYHFFKTCNCWVNNALKEAGIRTATWAPFSRAIFHQLEKYDRQAPPLVKPDTMPRRRPRLPKLSRRTRKVELG
ncbi:MAG: TIGR02117 family protein [Bacteroidia bacterium]|nr:TIGR02117 family protein [Bacteroidia bacterium]